MGAPATAAQEISPQDAAETICALLKRTLESRRHYSRDHVTLLGLQKNLFSSLSTFLAQFEQMTLEIASTTLLMEGQAVLEEERREESIAHPLFLEGVHRLVFSRGLTEAEIARLCELWWKTLEEVKRPNLEQSFTTRFWEADISHVRLVSVTTFTESLTSSKDSGVREDHVKAMMDQFTSERLAGGSQGNVGRPKVVQLTKDNLEVLKIDALADITARDLERQDVSKRPPLPSLSEQEAQEIVRGVASDRSSAGRVVQALANATVLEGATELDRAVQTASSVFEYLAGLSDLESRSKLRPSKREVCSPRNRIGFQFA